MSRFVSTRGGAPAVGFAEAVATGLAPDGGLYVPAVFPDLRQHFDAWSRLTYAELAGAFMSVFADEGEADRVAALVTASYSRFTHAEVAPLVPLGNSGNYVLELFHGPTLAFKDFALQALGNLYADQIQRTGQTINVLGATSGDTGAAAIHGLLGKPGVNIFILYPDGRISPLQERQMACTGADNVFPLAVKGSFDDTQRILKEVLGDQKARTALRLSAVNSINLARVLAQCVYYIYAWLRLPPEQRGDAEFVVPTGNFGNVLAGWMARQMGLPLASLKVATNRNDILYRLFTAGDYSTDAVAPSLAPAMDIQVASNFERYLYYACEQDADQVRAWMETFRDAGKLELPTLDRDIFTATRATDEEIIDLIGHVYREFNYVVDPHTACGFKQLDADRPSVVLGTAHPAKFPEAMQRALGFAPTAPTLDALANLPVHRYEIDARAAEVTSFLRAHAVTSLPASS